MSRKTQVHPFAPNDHVHTRLTHSLEVAEVGKALGKSVAREIAKDLPKGIGRDDLSTILQAACLAHDIGNPPFGHAGESAMSHWFDSDGARYLDGLSREAKKDLSVFEGNAQGFRIIAQTDNYRFDGGLRLTYATLGAFLKYPWSSRSTHHATKFGAFITEEEILADVAKTLGLVNVSPHRWCRHPLAFLSEASDDICYATIDLEDAVELGILNFDDVVDLLLRSMSGSARREVKKRFCKSQRVNFARLRGPVFDALTSGAVEAFISKYKEIMNGTFHSELFMALPKSDPRRAVISEAKEVATKRIFPDRKKLEAEIGCLATFECLLDAFCEAALACAQQLASPKGEASMGWRSELIIKLLAEHAPMADNAPRGLSWSKHMCIRRVLDYISGMTDNYASYLAKQLQGLPSVVPQRP